MKNRTGELREAITQAAEDAEAQNESDMGSWEHYKDLLVINILKACKEKGLVFIDYDYREGVDNVGEIDIEENTD